MRRSFLAAGHVLFSLAAWLALVLCRRRGVLAFTHLPDVDGTGRDQQMGPLVDALAAGRTPLAEVTFVPLGGGLWRNWRLKRRPFVSHAALAALGRVLGSRERAARLLLRSLRPRAVYLIDESGSGQPLLRAARGLGIRTVGVQHGDFRAGDPHYDLPAGTACVPADVMCVWSDWFRQRLIRISPIYGLHNTRVTGRLRYATEPEPPRRAGRPVRVLLLADAGAGSAAAVAPFAAALRCAADMALAVRPHPSTGAAERDLATDLDRCDVAIGRRSSALLEAVYRNRPAVVLGGGCGDDSPGVRCDDPGELAGLCRRLAAVPPDPAARARLWSGAAGDPVAAVLAAGRR